MYDVLSPGALFGLGFLLGLRHSVDSDHIAAVSAIISNTKSLKKSSLLGAVWGAGHTFVLFLIGIVILIFKITIPDVVALSFELAVGFMLLALGLDVLRKLRRDSYHFHLHKHGKKIHAHLHSHLPAKNHNHAHKSFAVGMVHGLAGSSALTLLVLGASGSAAEGILFILLFGIGSIAGMVASGIVIGMPFRMTQDFTKINSALKLLTGVLSIAIGVSIVYQTLPAIYIMGPPAV